MQPLERHARNRAAFELGADHARYGLRRPRPKNVPSEFIRGYDSFKGRAQKSRDWATNKWLALRLSAIRRNLVVTDDVTPQFLDEISVTRCPITLVTLTKGTGQDTDASIDRIINNGAYAQANLVVISVRANQEKGELTFEDVMKKATTRDSFKGLSQKEWARLVTIMLGAEVQINAKHKDLDVPLCTNIPPHIFIQPVQLLQESLLTETMQNHIFHVPFWRAETYKTKGDTLLYDHVRDALKAELVTCDYPYDAWYRMTPFWAFMKWFDEMQPAIARVLISRKQSYFKRISNEAQFKNTWCTITQGKYALSSPEENVISPQSN